MTELTYTLARLVLTNPDQPAKTRTPGGLALSYHPANGASPHILAGRQDQHLNDSETAELVKALSAITRRPILTSRRGGQANGYHLTELTWQPAPIPTSPAPTAPASPAPVVDDPAPGQPIYQAIYWAKGYPISIAISTDPEQIRQRGRRSGKRWELIEYHINPTQARRPPCA